MSPALYRSSAIQHFEWGDAIKLRDGITFEFYHMYVCLWRYNHLICINKEVPNRPWYSGIGGDHLWRGTPGGPGQSSLGGDCGCSPETGSCCSAETWQHPSETGSRGIALWAPGYDRTSDMNNSYEPQKQVCGSPVQKHYFVAYFNHVTTFEAL